MVRSAILVCCFALLVAACGTKDGPPPAVPAKTNANKPNTPAIPPAPKGVPQALRDQVAKAWPAIEEMGKEFDAKFAEFSVAQRAGDRAKMDQLGPPLNQLYNKLADAWIVIAYYPDDLDDEKQAEACRQYLRPWNSQVEGWTKKAKGIKEFSTVK